MSIDRRKPEAAGIRALFQAQWDHITDLLDQRLAQREADRQRQARELQAVESVVEGTDARMRLVSRYKSRLRNSVRVLLEYVEELVARVPGPIPVSGERFFLDPRLSAFFVNREAIREVFSRSHELQAFFSDPQQAAASQACAILLMTKREREILGMELTGEVVTRDVRQTSVTFTDHQVSQVRVSEAEVRSALEQFLFDGYVEYVHYRLTCLRAGLIGLCARCADLEMPDGMTPDQDRDLKNPVVYLEELSQVLEQPEQLLRLEAGTVRVNRIGIKVPEGSSVSAHDLHLHEIGLGAHARQVLALVTFPRDELLSQETLWRRAGVG